MNFLKYIKNPVTGSQLLIATEKSVLSNKKKLLDLQKKQWSEGKDKHKKTIGVYSFLTEEIAKQAPFPNKPKIAGKPYNLDWNGNLKRETFVKTKKSSNDIEITIDSKGKSLKALFGTIKKFGFLSDPNTIFGFQNKNHDEITKTITKNTLSNLKNRIK